jgi:hypothetical protein
MPPTTDSAQMPATKDIAQIPPTQGILQMAAQMIEIQPLKRALGGNRYLELKEWNGSKRVDLRFWKDGTVPTKDVSFVSDMASPIYWFFFYDYGKQIVDDVGHVTQGFPLIQM